MKIGDNIAKLRKEKGLTQEEFGEMLGVSRQSVSKWESDLSFPETEKLLMISKIFSCSLDSLLNNTTSEVVELKEEKKKLNYYNAICAVVFSVVMLLCYLLPYDKAYIDMSDGNYVGIFNNDLYLVLNFYNLVFSSSYSIGNVIFLTHFLLTLIILIVGILLFFEKNKKIFKVNFYTLIANLVIGVILLASGFEGGISSGAVIIPLLSVIYLFLFLYMVKRV